MGRSVGRRTRFASDAGDDDNRKHGPHPEHRAGCEGTERQTVHRLTRCLASEFIGPQNKKYLQLDTYGSDDREFPEKVSQAIQFDEDGARELLSLIKATFPSLTD